LAEHYQLGSVWMGLHAFEEVRRGLIRWEDWLPDGLHPEVRGSACYADSVIAYLERELADRSAEPPAPAGPSLPQPLDGKCWERVAILPFEQLQWEGPWSIRRWGNSGWIDRALVCHAPGARLSGRFQGRGLVLAADFGKASGELRWRIDGGDWRETQRVRAAWVGDSGWFHFTLLADDLDEGPHTFEIETTRPTVDGCRGATAAIALIGTIRKVNDDSRSR
jgi:hypothetical protein